MPWAFTGSSRSNRLEHGLLPRPMLTLFSFQLPGDVLFICTCFSPILKSYLINFTLYRCCFRFSKDWRKPPHRFWNSFFCSSHLSSAFPCRVPGPQSPRTLVSASSSRLVESHGFSLPVLRSRKCLLVESWLISRFPFSQGSQLYAACCSLPDFLVISMGGQVYHLLCRFLLLFIVVGMYSLQKQVGLASRGYHGLHFANHIPQDNWTCFSGSLYLLGIGSQVQVQYWLTRKVQEMCTFSRWHLMTGCPSVLFCFF